MNDVFNELGFGFRKVDELAGYTLKVADDLDKVFELTDSEKIYLRDFCSSLSLRSSSESMKRCILGLVA